MASGKIQGITVEIAGKTSGLVDSLKTADKAISKTQSALKAIDKALEFDPTNTELLAQKQELLAKAVNETSERLNILKQTAELAAQGLEDGTTTKEQYAELTAEIAKTEKQLENMADNSEDAAEEMDELADNTEEASDEAEKGSFNWDKFGKAAAAAGAAAAAAMAAAGAAIVEVTKFLTDCTVSAAGFADEVLTMSTVTGIATDDLQAYMYAAELVDVSIDTLTGSMSKNIKSMTAAQDGTGAAAEAYAALGVSVTNADGSLRDGQEVYWELIDALGQVEDETTRDSLSMSILGKSAQDLNPLIEAGADRMQELAGQAEEAGYIMSGDTLEAFGEFDDQLQYLDVGATAAKNALGGILLPILTDLAGEGVDLLGEFTTKLNEADGDVSQIGPIIGEMLPEVLNVISSYIPMILELAGTIVMSILDALLANADQILTTAASIIETLAMGILQALPTLVPTIISVLMGIVDFAVENIDLILEISFEIFEALISGISSNLPKLLPAVISIINSINQFALSHIDEIIVMAAQLILGLVTGFLSSTPEILSGVGQVISSILGALGDLGGELVDMALSWGADLIDNFISGITGAAGRLWDTITGIAQTVKDTLGFSVPKIGPLHEWAAHNPGADMVDLWSDGVDDNLGTLQNSMQLFGDTIADGATTNYSGQLAGISSQLGALGGGQPIIAQIYLGSEMIETQVLNAQNRLNFISGGH